MSMHASSRSAFQAFQHLYSFRRLGAKHVAALRTNQAPMPAEYHIVKLDMHVTSFLKRNR
jgi:hypothetical protein